MKQYVQITKDFSFEAAHYLPEYEGACAAMHGHSYKLSVTVGGTIDSKSEIVSDRMVIDFKDLKHIVNTEVIKAFDHSCLNDHFSIPTAETIAVFIFELLWTSLPKDVDLISVKLWETADSFVEVR